MNFWIVLLCSIVIFFCGFVVGRVRIPDGILEIDTSDNEKDRYNFVITRPIDDIPKKKYLKIKVELKSQKFPSENF